jgi:hypothetical protein
LQLSASGHEKDRRAGHHGTETVFQPSQVRLAQSASVQWDGLMALLQSAATIIQTTLHRGEHQVPPLSAALTDAMYQREGAANKPRALVK